MYRSPPGLAEPFAPAGGDAAWRGGTDEYSEPTFVTALLERLNEAHALCTAAIEAGRPLDANALARWLPEVGGARRDATRKEWGYLGSPRRVALGVSTIRYESH